MITLARLCRIADQKGFEINSFIPQLKIKALELHNNEYEFTKKIANELAIYIQLNCPERKIELKQHKSHCQVNLHGYEEKYCTC